MSSPLQFRASGGRVTESSRKNQLHVSIDPAPPTARATTQNARLQPTIIVLSKPILAYGGRHGDQAPPRGSFP